MKRAKYIVSLFFFYSLSLFGQVDHYLLTGYIEQVIEQVISSNSGEPNVETIISDLEELYANPININAATESELDKLWILTDFQIKSLVDYRRSVGKIISVNELNYIYGFDEKTTQLILPFIAIGDRIYSNNNSHKRSKMHFRSEVLTRFTQNNVSSSNHIGNNQKYYFRYKGWYNRSINVGFLAEKDAGEEFFTGANQKGFDSYSGFILYKGKAIESFVLGDYRIRAGQGLLMWPGYSSGKSSQVTSIQKRGQGINGNSSADEYGFLRGSAVNFTFRQFSLSLFASYKLLDATIDSTQMGIKTLRTDGLHRTESEAAYKNNIREEIFGTSLNYRGQHVQWNLQGFKAKYSLEFVESVKPYQKYNFSDQKYFGVSTDYKILLQQFQIYGEIAYANNSFAGITGVNLMPHPQFITSLSYRIYQNGYYSPYSNALSEGSSISGEQGIYVGLQWQTDWNIRLATYADLFSFQWVKFGVNGPSEGKEYIFEGNYTNHSGFELILRYKFQEKPKNYSGLETTMHSLEVFGNSNYRMHLHYNLSEKVSMSTRAEFSESGFVSDKKTDGYLLYQDINYHPNSKFRITFRYAWFDVESYSSRIYAYEHSARYVYSMPPYYDKGTKTYALLKYDISSWLSLWGRYSHTNYFKETLQNKNEGLIQLLLKF